MLHKLMNHFYATPEKFIHTGSQKEGGEGEAFGFTIAEILTELPEILTT